MSKDGGKDRTVIGGSLGNPSPLPGGVNPMPTGKLQATPNQSTVIGGALPQGGGFGGLPVGGGFGGDTGADAWGVVTGGFGTPAPVPGQPAGGFGGQPFEQSPIQQRPVAGAFAQPDSFFPDASTAQPTNYASTAPKIDLRRALTAKGLGAGGPKSPMLAAAANLLILF